MYINKFYFIFKIKRKKKTNNNNKIPKTIQFLVAHPKFTSVHSLIHSLYVWI